MWLMQKQRGKNIADFLKNHSYQKIAIYGFKKLGERLFDKLRKSEIDVIAIIDKNAEIIHADVNCFRPDDKLPEFDVLIVTATAYFDEIESDMKMKTHKPILSLEDIILLL